MRIVLRVERPCGNVVVALASEEEAGHEEVTDIRNLAHQGKEPVFAQVKISPEALVFVMPPADGGILTSRFRQSVLGDEARYN